MPERQVIEISADLAGDLTAPAGPEIEFTLQDKNPIEGGKPIEKTVVFNPPDVNVLIMLLARVESSNDLQLVGTMINTFFSMIKDESDVRYFNKRLFDSKDPFSAGHIAKIMSSIVEGWSGNPTDGSPASSASRSRSGHKSKRRAHGKGSTPGTAPSTTGASSSTASSEAG
jgi:hypothetical protein